MAADAGGGGGDRPVGRGWNHWKAGNQNSVVPAPAQKAGKKAKVASLIDSKNLPHGVDDKELVKFEYQASTGDAELDKQRNELVDDYNDIGAKRLKIYQRVKFANVREEIKEVLKMASKAKKRHDEMKSSHRHPHPYPSHFDQAPKLKL